jgi:hypothetical protein
MTLDLIVTIGIVLVAGVYLFRKFRKKDGGCCGCNGCSGDLQPLDGRDCPTHKK